MSTDNRRVLAIDDVRYGREGWSQATLFVGKSRDGSDDVELTTPMQIIRLDPGQADQLLDELRAIRSDREIRDLRLAEQ